MQKAQGWRCRGISVPRVLAVVGVLTILISYAIYHANFVLGRSLLFAFPDWEVTYRSAWPLPTGGVVARDVLLIPPDGAEDGTFRFASIRVEVPFVQYYRSGFSRERGALLNAIRDLHIELDGGHGDLTYPFTRELALFGNVSAAPFEAEGCASDSLWLENELGEMGLDPQGTRLVLEYHDRGSRFVKQQTLHTPGAGRVDFRRELIRTDAPSMFSLVEGGQNTVAMDEWHLRDEGFVVARNRHCERKDHVSDEEFLRRHLLSAERLLATVGLAPAPDLAAAYRGYAARGGALDVVVHYDPPIGAPLYGASDLGSWLPRLRGTLAVDGRDVALTFEATGVRPLPEGDNAATTYEIVQRELAAQNPAGNPESAPAAADPGPAPAPAPVAGRAAGAEQATAAERTGLAHVDAGAITSGAAEAVASGLRYEQLAGYVGKHLTVFLRGREPIRVQVLRASGANIVVRRALSGGDIEYVLDRSGFDHAEP